MVGCQPRNLWLKKLCQKLEYCHQIYANTLHLFLHTRWYLIHHPHLCMTHFHSHPPPQPTQWCMGYYWANFWCTHSPDVKFAPKLCITILCLAASCACAGDDIFPIHFYPNGCFEGGHPRTRYYMTNFCCVMSPELQFGLKLPPNVSYHVAKAHIRRMKGSSLTYTHPWYTTVVSNTRHTLGPTFVAHNPLSWSWNTSFPWMCSTTLQKSRYGTWSVRPLFIPP